jgi:hypothetical protein
MIADHAPMHHKEQVRIASGKALAMILGTIDPKSQDSLQLVEALIMLLNDEQPDIRYYLCESEQLDAVFESDKWTVYG